MWNSHLEADTCVSQANDCMRSQKEWSTVCPFTQTHTSDLLRQPVGLPPATSHLSKERESLLLYPAASNQRWLVGNPGNNSAVSSHSKPRGQIQIGIKPVTLHQSEDTVIYKQWSTRPRHPATFASCCTGKCPNTHRLKYPPLHRTDKHQQLSLPVSIS